MAAGFHFGLLLEMFPSKATQVPETGFYRRNRPKPPQHVVLDGNEKRAGKVRRRTPWARSGEFLQDQFRKLQLEGKGRKAKS
jgi:hypothetical protein